MPRNDTRPKRSFFKRFRGESISIILACVQLLIGLVALSLNAGDRLFVAIITFGSIVTTLLLIALFNLKRLFRLRFEQLDRIFDENKSRLDQADKILLDYFGFSWRKNQYFSRLQHFTDEKQELASCLVEGELPDLLDKILIRHNKVAGLNIILDSGTTITPIFPLLAKQGIATKRSIELRFYTNNLSGIDELHKLDVPKDCPISESSFNLIGGQPLNMYRATTGTVTQKFLQELWAGRAENAEAVLTVSVITANWVLAGRHLDEISICAKGRGHFAFKKDLIDHSDYIIVMAPLGKILRVDETDSLDEASQGPYKAYPFPKEKRNRFILMTSFRPRVSQSPLARHSEALMRTRDSGDSQNYLFSEHCPIFDPSSRRIEAIVTDLPHGYVRDNFEDFFGFKLEDPLRDFQSPPTEAAR